MQKLKAIRLAREQLDKHGLQDWVVRYSPRAVNTFGVCYHQRKCILLSLPLVQLNSEVEVLDVILHEIAHALAGHTAGHGKEWQAVCRQIGARPERCYSTATVTTPPPRFIGECPKCLRVITRNRRNTLSCGRCSPKEFNPDCKFNWRRNNDI